MRKCYRNSKFLKKSKDCSLSRTESKEDFDPKKIVSNSSDLIKSLKPCFVRLKRITINKNIEVSHNGFQLYKANSSVDSSFIVLKPCSVKLLRMSLKKRIAVKNFNEAELRYIDPLPKEMNPKPCNVIMNHVVVPFSSKTTLNKIQADFNSILSEKSFDKVTDRHVEDKPILNKEVHSTPMHFGEKVNALKICEVVGSENNLQQLNQELPLKTGKFSSGFTETSNDSQATFCGFLKINVKHSGLTNENSKTHSVFSSFEKCPTFKKSLICDSNKSLNIPLNKVESLLDIKKDVLPFYKSNEDSQFPAMKIPSFQSDTKYNCIDSKNLSQTLVNSTDIKCIHVLCSQCGTALPSLKALYYHTCELKQKRGFLCKFCVKNFDIYHSFKKHLKSHALKPSLNCSDAIKERLQNVSMRKRGYPVDNCQKNIFCKLNKTVTQTSNDKKNSSLGKCKLKKLKAKFMLENPSVASTSTGYSSNTDFLGYILNLDDSETEL